MQSLAVSHAFEVVSHIVKRGKGPGMFMCLDCSYQMCTHNVNKPGSLVERHISGELKNKHRADDKCAANTFEKEMDR